MEDHELLPDSHGSLPLRTQPLCREDPCHRERQHVGVLVHSQSRAGHLVIPAQVPAIRIECPDDSSPQALKSIPVIQVFLGEAPDTVGQGRVIPTVFSYNPLHP